MAVCPNECCKYNNISPKVVVIMDTNGIDRVKIWHSLCVKCETKLPLNENKDPEYIHEGSHGEFEWHPPLSSYSTKPLAEEDLGQNEAAGHKNGTAANFLERT